MCLHNWPFKQHAYTYIRYFTVGSSVCVPNGANLYRPFQEYDLTSILLTPSSTKTVNETSLSFNLTLHSWSQLSCNLWVRGWSPNEILLCYHSNKSYWVVLFPVVLFTSLPLYCWLQVRLKRPQLWATEWCLGSCCLAPSLWRTSLGTARRYRRTQKFHFA